MYCSTRTQGSALLYHFAWGELSTYLFLPDRILERDQRNDLTQAWSLNQWGYFQSKAKVLEEQR